MPNITVRKENGNRPLATPTAPQWEPGRIMRALLDWDPFREMVPFAIDERAGFAPAFEVKETKDAYLFKADVPGVKESDIEVTLTGNRLTIGGKREAEKQEQTDTYYTYERSYGSFQRSFTLPEGTDANNVRAELKDGVLTVSLPKTPEAQPKKINVNAPTTKS